MVRAGLVVVLTLAGGHGAPAWSQTADVAGPAEAVLHKTDAAPVAAATMQMFTELDSGGIQRVVARDPADEFRVRLVRTYLRGVRDRFLRGDLAGLARDSGANATGLLQLGSAASGSMVVGYSDIPGGGELTYFSAHAALVAVLHRWFEALASDPDANVVIAHGQGGNLLTGQHPF